MKLQIYERLSDVYDLDWGSWSYQYVDVVKRQLRTMGIAKARILDLACGTGSLALELVGLGHTVLGVDISPNMIKVARLKADGVAAVDFKISGQINRAALYADDGDTAKWFFVDNDNSSTRFRFTGSNDFEHDWSVGIVWEVEMQSDPSNKVHMGDDGSDLGDVNFDERKMEFWVEKWGRMWLGQGDTASNSSSEIDLSGTTVATYSDIAAVGGSFEFKDNGVGTGITVGDSRSNFDRAARLRQVWLFRFRKFC